MEVSARQRIATTACSACGREVRLTGRVMIGEVFGCGSCDAQLEVASLDPLVLEPLAKVDEDRDEDPDANAS